MASPLGIRRCRNVPSLRLPVEVTNRAHSQDGSQQQEQHHKQFLFVRKRLRAGFRHPQSTSVRRNCKFNQLRYHCETGSTPEIAQALSSVKKAADRRYECRTRNLGHGSFQKDRCPVRQIAMVEPRASISFSGEPHGMNILVRLGLATIQGSAQIRSTRKSLFGLTSDPNRAILGSNDYPRE